MGCNNCERTKKRLEVMKQSPNSEKVAHCLDCPFSIKYVDADGMCNSNHCITAKSICLQTNRNILEESESEDFSCPIGKFT